MNIPSHLTSRIKVIVWLVWLFSNTDSNAQNISNRQYTDDFQFFWNSIIKDYCYWDKKNTDFKKVPSIYESRLDTITTTGSFVALLEDVLNEVYDHHASLNTNTRHSPRLVPSGADVWANYFHQTPLITDVRKGFGAEQVGVKSGMEVVAVNDIPIEQAVTNFLGKSLSTIPVDAKDYALRMVLAGNRAVVRKLTLKHNDVLLNFYPDRDRTVDTYPQGSYIESRRINDIGYIKIKNNLYDNNLVHAFDSVLNSLINTQALILDLRETPSGGNTTVARGIIGRFIEKEGFYQKHELTAEEQQYGVKRSWMEIVSPRGKTYKKPLVILCGHWTGSVGEGITIGFDALKRATTIGTQMAQLSGAIYSYRMPNTGIGFSFPVEKLYHVNGTPRESYRPKILLKQSRDNSDNALEVALKFFNRKAKAEVSSLEKMQKQLQ